MSARAALHLVGFATSAAIVAGCQLELPAPAGVSVRPADAAADVAVEGGVDAAAEGGVDAGRDGNDAGPDAPCAAPVTISVGDNGFDDHAGRTVDTMLRALNPTYNYGASDKIEADDGPEVCLFRFDLQGLVPPGATIAAARLMVTTTGNESVDSFTVHRVLEAWQPGDGDGTAGEANWDNRLPDTPWSNAGCGAPDSRAAAIVGTVVPGAPDTRYAIPIGLAAVQQWVEQPEQNHGLVLVPTDNDGVGFRATEASDGERPSLELTYCP